MTTTALRSAGAQRGAMVLRHYYGHDDGSLVDVLADLADYAREAGYVNLVALAETAHQRAERRRRSEDGRYPLGVFTPTRQCRGCSKVLPLSDPDLCEVCDLHASAGEPLPRATMLEPYAGPLDLTGVDDLYELLERLEAEGFGG